MHVSKLLQSCSTLCDHIKCSLPGSSVHGVFSRQEYRSGWPCPPLGDLLDPVMGLLSLTSPASAGRSFITNVTSEAQRKIITFSEAQRKIIKFSVLGLTLEDHWKWVLLAFLNLLPTLFPTTPVLSLFLIFTTHCACHYHVISSHLSFKGLVLS